MAHVKYKALVRSVLSAMLLALALTLAPTQALAVGWASNNTWVVAPAGDGIIQSVALLFEDAGVTPTITNVKSSNTKVAKVEKGDDCVWVDYRSKVGTTTISCTVNGVRLSKVFRVKYTSPVQRITVAGKNLTTKFRKKNVFTDTKTYRNKKVVIKAKAGWVITEVTNIKNFNERTKKYRGRKSLTVKIKTVAPFDGLRVTFKNTKTGAVQEVDYVRGYKGTGYRPVAG